ncbi:MAG TPA: uroporphyrinogen decarboxylase family protein, partial [Burkholderiales bacterium]|nr:uroporphyrinogen decarboxylase family protein [Burkholderiales bacterium]
VGLDWGVDIGGARARIGDRVALQGNLDPAVLFAPAEVVQREAEKTLAAFGFGDGHVFNLGHGISQFTPPDAVKILVDCVHQSSLRYHRDKLNTRAS